MKKDLCWEKSFVRNSYDEVYVINSWLEVLIIKIKQPVLKIKRRVLGTGYSYIYLSYICSPLIYRLIFYKYIGLSFIYAHPADWLQPISLLSFKQVGS